MSRAQQPKYTKLIDYLIQNLEKEFELDQELLTRMRQLEIEWQKKRLAKKEGNVDMVTFGKYKGKTYTQVAVFDLDYLKWIAKQSFLKPEQKAKIREVMDKHPINTLL